MSAICKTIPVHSSSLNPLMEYVENNDKSSVSEALKNNPELNVSRAMDYAANPLKTICNVDEDHKELLVSGVKCDPNTAAQEFELVREKYRSMTGNYEKYEDYEWEDKKTGKKRTVKRIPVTAIHLIQSFEEADLDPHTVHQIGLDVAERMGLQAVVCTHLNKKHLHNHIILNTYREDGRKWCCGLDERIRLRELSDEIQREYGIPVNFHSPQEQLFRSRGGMTYHEWSAEQDGTSWKDNLRDDIATVSAIAKDREEYISLMESYGYTAERVTDKSITFRVQENRKKIRDTTLGKEYGVGELFPDGQKREEKPKQKTDFKKPQKITPIRIPRYTWNGRRRTELEMIILTAIAIIKRIGILFSNLAKMDDSRKPESKIARLQEALNTITKYKISTVKELQERTNETGASLSHAKAVLSRMEVEKPLYDEISAAIATIESARMVNTNLGDMELHDYTAEEIRKNKSEAAPLPPAMKSKVAAALHRHPGYKVACKYEELSPAEAMAVTDFLGGRATEKPDVLMTEEEYYRRNAAKMMDGIYEKRMSVMRERFAGKPGEYPLKTCAAALKAHGQEVDLEKLTAADVMEINDCYGNNPFAGPLVTDEEKRTLEAALKKAGKEINRNLQYATKDEFKHVMRYLDGKTTKEPPLMKPFEEPYERDIEQLKSFMAEKDVESVVPLEALSRPDFMKLYSYTICTGRTPSVLKDEKEKSGKTTEEKDTDFYTRINKYKSNRALYLAELRNALNALRSYGYDLDENSPLDAVKADLQKWNAAHLAAEAEKENLSQTYHELLTAKQTISYAKQPSYLYGDLYNAERDGEIKVEQTEERDKKEDRKEKEMKGDEH